MDLHDVLKQGITFGPFQTAHHRSIVNAEFQAAFLRHIARAIVPNLTIGTDRVEGTVRADYDDEKYFGPRSAVKFKYTFEGMFRQGERRERVDLKFEFVPGPEGFRLDFGEPSILTARSFEQHREDEQEALRQLDREADAVLDPRRSIEDHWISCETVWRRADAVLGEALGPARRRPLASHLCERFAHLHPDSESFLIDKLRGADPIPAAYAFSCWIRLAKSKRGRLPEEVVARKEPIPFHSGCFASTVPLGEWISEYLKEEG